MEISKLEKFHSTVFLNISYMQSAFAVEYFYALKIGSPDQFLR